MEVDVAAAADSPGNCESKERVISFAFAFKAFNSFSDALMSGVM